MITKKQAEILDVFRKNILLEITIRALADRIGKAYPKIYDAVKEFEKQGIIKIQKIGNSSLCSVNLNDHTSSLLSFLEEQEAYLKNIPNITRILNFEEFFEDIILVTGSYAKGKQTKTSDIDLVVITKTDVFKKQKLLENKTSLFIPEVHPITISEQDFIKMLLDKEENFGKETFKYKLIFRNANRYYQLIKEAIKNGFRS